MSTVINGTTGITSPGLDANGTNTIAGTTTNDSAAAGDVGELLSSSVAANSVALTVSGTVYNVTSLSLTAGDWEISGAVSFSPQPTTSVTLIQVGSNTTSATIGTISVDYNCHAQAAVVPGVQGYSLNIPQKRVSIASTTTIYLTASATFTVSTIASGGIIRARRVR